MRVLGFSQKWPKLKWDEFTTFRFSRKDSDKGRDWKVGEVVQIVYHPRSKDREMLGVAEIIRKEPRTLLAGTFYFPSDDEAIADGFDDVIDMAYWFHKQYGDRIYKEPMNKLTLRWRNLQSKE